MAVGDRNRCILTIWSRDTRSFEWPALKKKKTFAEQRASSDYFNCNIRLSDASTMKFPPIQYSTTQNRGLK